MYGAKPETINESINMNSVLLTQIININTNYENIINYAFIYIKHKAFNNKNTNHNTTPRVKYLQHMYWWGKVNRHRTSIFL